MLEAKDIIFSPIETARETEEEPKELKLSSVEKNTILKVIEKNKLKNQIKHHDQD